MTQLNDKQRRAVRLLLQDDVTSKNVAAAVIQSLRELGFPIQEERPLQERMFYYVIPGREHEFRVLAKKMGVTDA